MLVNKIIASLFLSCCIIGISGCGPALLANGRDDATVVNILNELEGEWEVTEWLCDTGDGPFNFARNVGWQFRFAGDDLIVTQNEDFEMKFSIHVVEGSSPTQICIVCESDYDEDGTIDLAIQRNCLLKVESGKLIMVYGSLSTNISLNTGKGESISGMPSEFVAGQEGSLLTLEKSSR